jgi:hypothetical protein
MDAQNHDHEMYVRQLARSVNLNLTKSRFVNRYTLTGQDGAITVRIDMTLDEVENYLTSCRMQTCPTGQL